MPIFMKLAVFQIFGIACYVFYVYFSFCDGFKLKISRKIIWAICFISFCYFSLQTWGRFYFPFIVGTSSLIAFILAWFQQKEKPL